VMANATVAFFMIHSKRSKNAFEALIKDWTGILAEYVNENETPD